MRIREILALGLLLTGLHTSPAFAAGEHQALLREFLVGQYTLIGRTIDSGIPYTGQVHIGLAGQQLTISRHIGTRTTTAVGQIEQATADKVDVLRIRFREDGKAVEGTCLIGGDLDNYARLSCQLYWQGTATREPGLEAYFIRHAP